MVDIVNQMKLNSTSIHLWNKAITMFNIEGLPPSIIEPIFILFLYSSGFVGVWEENGEIHYGTAQYGGGRVLEDGTNSKVIINNATRVVEKNVEEVGLIWLNSFRYPISDIIERYARLLYEADVSLNTALINSRSTKVPVARTDSEKTQLEELMKAQRTGAHYVPMIPIGELKDTPIFDLNQSTRSDTLPQIMDVRQRLMSEYDNQLGIGVYDGMKRERMITSELNNIMSSSRINVQDMYDCISVGLDDCNIKLGTSMQLKWNDCYNVINTDFVSEYKEVNNNDISGSIE